MRTTIITNENKAKEYPWVGLWVHGLEQTPPKRVVILFTKQHKGICLEDVNSSTHFVGKTSETWVEEDFEPCSITLSSLE